MSICFETRQNKSCFFSQCCSVSASLKRLKDLMLSTNQTARASMAKPSLRHFLVSPVPSFDKLLEHFTRRKGCLIVPSRNGPEHVLGPGFVQILAAIQS